MHVVFDAGKHIEEVWTSPLGEVFQMCLTNAKSHYYGLTRQCVII